MTSPMKGLQSRMKAELRNKEIFEFARRHAFDYLDQIEGAKVFPSETDLAAGAYFRQALQKETLSAQSIMDELQTHGLPLTVAHSGPRYFGFVNGGALPVSLGVKWLTDVWDQCGGLYLSSPLNAILEQVCEEWLIDLLSLPTGTRAGFVSGTSMANLSALAAGRYRLLSNLGYDLNVQGLREAPKIRILAHDQSHASVRKSLAILGFGSSEIEILPSDDQGRLKVDAVPELDSSCLILLQAGNVNTGAFDEFDQICDRAQAVGAWVHVDGAFGLWAAASKSLRHLTAGVQKANSWAVDGHKTLNTPYDSGIVLCRDPEALVSALHATAAYILPSAQRDPIQFGPEMSKRSRAIELWAVMRYLGKDGIDQLVSGLHHLAVKMAAGLASAGYEIINDVVFNQVLVGTDSDEITARVLAKIQRSGKCWAGGSQWRGRKVIRVSICSWMTEESDIDIVVDEFRKAIR